MMSGVYYATVMVLTTAATVTGVMILSLHHKVTRTNNVSLKWNSSFIQGREGVAVPTYLRKVAQ